MGNYNDFDLDIKKVQGENDIGPASNYKQTYNTLV